MGRIQYLFHQSCSNISTANNGKMYGFGFTKKFSLDNTFGFIRLICRN